MKNILLSLTSLLLPFSLISQNIVPQKDGDLYSLEFKNIYFAVDASFGGHISAFEVGGKNILFPSQGGSDILWGSTLWPSPQSVWGWPPSTILDSEPYSAEITANKIVMRSGKDSKSKLVFEKSFYADELDTAVIIDYVIINEGTSAYSVAAWEVCRVYSGGLTFFPKGEGSVWDDFASQTVEMNGLVWYEHESNDPANQKFFSDGSDGWMAHVTEDNYLFIKKYDDVLADDSAPGEAEVELWYAGLNNYIELENQSVYQSIPAGGSLKYTMKWYLRELLGEPDVSIGSESLVNTVENVIFKNAAGLKNSSLAKIRVFPNPASKILRITCDLKTSFAFSLYDITGKRVFQRKNLIINAEFNIEDLNSGLYFYRLEGDGINRSGKLVIR